MLENDARTEEMNASVESSKSWEFFLLERSNPLLSKLTHTVQTEHFFKIPSILNILLPVVNISCMQYHSCVCVY